MKVSLLVFIFLSFVFVSACNSRSQEAEQVITPDPYSDVPRKHLLCGSMPPIQDTAKLKASLKERGVITEQMTDDEAEKVVVEYIRQRQQAFQKCKKGDH